MKSLGRDYTPTFVHYITAFRIEHGRRRLALRRQRLGQLLRDDAGGRDGRAADGRDRPADGLAADARRTSRGKRAFEFATLLSFAIPGTVVGVSYILAFNVPPIELTGTG